MLFVVFEASQDLSVAKLIIIATWSPFFATLLPPFCLLFTSFLRLFLPTWYLSQHPLWGISVPHGPITTIPTLFFFAVLEANHSLHVPIWPQDKWRKVEEMFPPQCKIESEFWEVYVNCKCYFVCLPLYLVGRAYMLWKSTTKKWNVVFCSKSYTCYISDSPFYVVTWKIWPINQWNRFNSDQKKFKKTGLHVL